MRIILPKGRDMAFKDDVDRLFTFANDLTDEYVAERVRQLARELDKQEASRIKSDSELVASDMGKQVSGALHGGGLSVDDATVASIVREMLAKTKVATKR
jgi:hypothetical protein